MILVCYGLLFTFVIQFPASSSSSSLDPGSVVDEDAGSAAAAAALTQDSPDVSAAAAGASPSTPMFFQLPLDSEDKYRIFWTLDYKTETATIEVRANLDKETDWFAIGFSDYGNVSNADLCVLWFDWRLKSHFDVSEAEWLSCRCCC